MIGDGSEVHPGLFGFDTAAYRALLRDFRALGYSSVGLREIDPEQRHLFLRHDVDLCLRRAAKIAEVEQQEGFRATYYILVSTRAYNPASAESRSLLGRIAALGHAIGLHFDATAYSGSATELEAFAEEECAVLERLAGVSVDSISFHRPAPALLGWTGSLAGRPHCYERRFSEEIGYVSDSSGGFYHGHPLDHPAVAAGRALHLLTHPIWWHSKAPRSAEDLLEDLREERRAALDKILAAATAKARTRAR